MSSPSCPSPLTGKSSGTPTRWNIFAMSSVRSTHASASVHISDNVTDEYENFNSPVSAATSFLFSLASNRTKSTFLPILAFVNRVLQSCGSIQLYEEYTEY